MNNATEERDALLSYLTKSQKEAFLVHNKIMHDLEESGFKPNPEQKVFPHSGQESSCGSCLQVRSSRVFY